MERKYFNSEEQEYLQNVKSLNEKINIFNNSYIASFPKDKENLNFQTAFRYEPIKMINIYYENKLSFSDKFYYALIMFLMKRFFDFDILTLKKNNRFIDIIIIKLINNLRENDIVELSKEILNELVDILYKEDILYTFIDQGKEKKRENIANIFECCISSPLLKGSAIIKPKGNTFDGDFSYEHKLEQINNFLNDWLAPNTSTKIIDNEEILHLAKNNDKSKEEDIPDLHEDKYKAIHNLLKDYITHASSNKIKAIINYKINNKNFNNIDGRSYFIMKSNIKRDICKFAQCFNITLKEAEKIFKTTNKKPINLNPKDSVSINMLDPSDFEKALIEVRNECLHKINPEKFKLLKK